MKKVTPIIVAVFVGVFVLGFAGSGSAEAGKSKFSLSIGHGGTHIGIGHGGFHGYRPAHCHPGRYVWVPGHWVGHGCHRDWIPGRYVYRRGHCHY